MSEPIDAKGPWRFPLALLAVYVTVFTVCAIAPYDRAVWWAENLPILVLVGAVVVVSRRLRLSNTAYALMAVLPILHTIGGHFTFERVPFDWVTETFGFERNHYDRVAHFSVGFYAFALAEGWERRELVRGRVLVSVLAVVSILALAGAYEILEWIYAVSTSDPDAGAAVLGSQGDVWDAQKDMLADTLGALVAVAAFAFVNRRGS